MHGLAESHLKFISHRYIILVLVSLGFKSYTSVIFRQRAETEKQLSKLQVSS